MGVTVRTIDRYIRRGKLFARQENNRIWLDRREVVNLPPPRTTRLNQPIDNKTFVTQTRPYQKTNEAAFYRDLYEEAKQTLNDYQQKLEQANYRIGQLESQNIHASPPRIIERREDTFAAEMLRKEIQEREKELFILKDLAQREKTSRIIFAAITYILLALLPLVWYLLR